ncbi:MAG TPA: thioredoxin family protein [Candidatus Saccharimonadales bacterium]|nr:thioredoxin family protein [Candidatus Saccharimonadales bacterium]
MNKKLWAVMLTIVALIAAGFAYVLLRGEPANNSSVTTPQAQATESTPSAAPQQQPPEAHAGAYTTYDEQTVATTKGTKILFFHAAWCPQCRQLEASIKAGKIPDGVTIFKVDYDNSQALRQKYSVTLQTTLVKIDDTGQEIKKFVAYDEPTLEALIKNLL